MRSPKPLLEQIDELRMYLRTLRADINRASREGSNYYLKRRITPFVSSLRFERLMRAYELEEVAGECLAHLRKARAMSIAEFAPGDQITMEVILQGHERPAERYVIRDIEWRK